MDDQSLSGLKTRRVSGRRKGRKADQVPPEHQLCQIGSALNRYIGLVS